MWVVVHLGSCQFFKHSHRRASRGELLIFQTITLHSFTWGVVNFSNKYIYLISRINIIGFEQREQTRVAGLVWYLQSFYWVNGSCQFLTFFFFFYLFL
jgi:hypothetical protein